MVFKVSVAHHLPAPVGQLLVHERHQVLLELRPDRSLAPDRRSSVRGSQTGAGAASETTVSLLMCGVLLMAPKILIKGFPKSQPFFQVPGFFCQGNPSRRVGSMTAHFPRPFAGRRSRPPAVTRARRGQRARTLSGAPRRSRPVYYHRGRTEHRAAAMLHGVRHRPSDNRRTLMPNDASMSAKGRRWFQMKGSIRQAMRGRPCRGGMCPPASAARSRGDLPHFRTVAAACLTQLRAPRRAGQALPRSTEAAGVTASMNAERRK